MDNNPLDNFIEKCKIECINTTQNLNIEGQWRNVTCNLFVREPPQSNVPVGTAFRESCILYYIDTNIRHPTYKTDNNRTIFYYNS